MSVREREIRVGAQGRIVLPASLRQDLGLKPGDRLIARKEGDSVVLEPASMIRKRLQSRFKDIPDDTRLAEELIADRRREARLEAGLP